MCQRTYVTSDKLQVIVSASNKHVNHWSIRNEFPQQLTFVDRDQFRTPFPKINLFILTPSHHSKYPYSIQGHGHVAHPQRRTRTTKNKNHFSTLRRLRQGHWSEDLMALKHGNAVLLLASTGYLLATSLFQSLSASPDSSCRVNHIGFSRFWIIQNKNPQWINIQCCSG